MGLETITKALGKAYKTQKTAEGKVKEKRLEFFDAIDEELEESDLATQTVEIPEDESAIEFVDKYYPAWRLVEEYDNGVALIEQNPAYHPYTYLSEDHKLIFRRGLVQAAPSLDDEKLRAEDFELWFRITSCSEENILTQYEQESGGDITPALVSLFIAKHREEFTRTLLPLEQIDADDLARLSDYTVPGRLTLKLEPIRKPKADELE